MSFRLHSGIAWHGTNAILASIRPTLAFVIWAPSVCVCTDKWRYYMIWKTQTNLFLCQTIATYIDELCPMPQKNDSNNFALCFGCRDKKTQIANDDWKGHSHHGHDSIGFVLSKFSPRSPYRSFKDTFKCRLHMSLPQQRISLLRPLSRRPVHHNGWSSMNIFCSFDKHLNVRKGKHKLRVWSHEFVWCAWFGRVCSLCL